VATVTFCTPPFRTLAQRRREALGLPDLRLVFLPHPMMTRTAEEIERIALEVVDEVAAHLAQGPVKEK
jgi:hypothetical protein